METVINWLRFKGWIDDRWFWGGLEYQPGPVIATQFFGLFSVSWWCDREWWRLSRYTVNWCLD